MSKSILVIDTPENCMKCPLIKQINTFIHQGYNCSRNDKKIEHILEKPDWCPLWELPDKKQEVKYHGNGCFGVNEAMKNSFNMGFNSCIDEILKGANRDE